MSDINNSQTFLNPVDQAKDEIGYDIGKLCSKVAKCIICCQGDYFELACQFCKICKRVKQNEELHTHYTALPDTEQLFSSEQNARSYENN